MEDPTKPTVTAVKETLHGHHLVQLSNGHGFTVHRGDPLPEVGDPYQLIQDPVRGVRHEPVSRKS